MILSINGQSKQITDNASLQDAAAAFCKNPELVICELNGAIIQRPQWATTRLNASDKLELVSFVGGG